jgi:hypothetical protein
MTLITIIFFFGVGCGQVFVSSSLQRISHLSMWNQVILKFAVKMLSPVLHRVIKYLWISPSLTYISLRGTYCLKFFCILLSEGIPAAYSKILLMLTLHDEWMDGLKNKIVISRQCGKNVLMSSWKQLVPVVHDPK